MAINKDTVSYVANLARLRLTPEEQRLFASQLNNILSYMEELNNLDTRKVRPMSHAVSMGNVFREDDVKDSLSSDDALQCAPEKEPPFFKVPKIIE